MTFEEEIKTIFFFKLRELKRSILYLGTKRQNYLIYKRLKIYLSFFLLSK